MLVEVKVHGAGRPCRFCKGESIKKTAYVAKGFKALDDGQFETNLARYYTEAGWLTLRIATSLCGDEGERIASSGRGCCACVAAGKATRPTKKFRRFIGVEVVFAGITVTREDRSAAYGELRLQTLGLWRDVVVFVAHTPPGEDDDHIISIRKADKHEHRTYWKNCSRQGFGPD